MKRKKTFSYSEKWSNMEQLSFNLTEIPRLKRSNHGRVFLPAVRLGVGLKLASKSACERVREILSNWLCHWEKQTKIQWIFFSYFVILNCRSYYLGETVYLIFNFLKRKEIFLLVQNKLNQCVCLYEFLLFIFTLIFIRHLSSYFEFLINI